MAEIQEVDRSISRQYRLPGKKETTNIRLLLTIGGKKKKVKIDQISNSRITENEFNHYKQHLGERFKLLTKEQISNRYKKIQNASNHVYSQEEITQMVHNKQGYNKEMVTDFFTARNSLMKRRMKAIETQDFDELTIIDKQIDVLENKFKIDKEKCDKIAIKFVSINKRNREENFKKDVAAGKKKKLESNDGVVASSSTNPYLRRETRPVNLWNTGVKLEKAKAEIDSGGVTIPSTNQLATNIDSNSISANSTVAHNLTIKHKIENDFYNYSTNFEEVRKRMRQRLGVDPYELSLEDPRERYLKKVCAGLPPIGSIERESIRKGIDLVIDELKKQIPNMFCITNAPIESDTVNLIGILSDISTSVDTATTTLNDFLSFDKMQSNIDMQFEKKMIVVDEFVRDCIKPFYIQAKAFNIEIVLNIQSNLDLESLAIQEEGRSLTPGPRGVIRISVADQGVGISQENQLKLFHMYVQINPMALQGGKGSGIGLCLSKRITELHGGIVGVCSDGEGRGSCFFFELPAYTKQSTLRNIISRINIQKAGGLSNTPRSDSRSRSLKSIADVIDEADDGDKAVDKIIEKGFDYYDVILIDFHMPRMNGPDAVKAMRELGCTSTIFGFTGTSDESDKLMFINNGAVDVLEKPLTLNAFRLAIQSNYLY
eukprot:gene20353-26417_t